MPRRKVQPLSGNHQSIRAGAGCGKSTTLEWNEFPDHIPSHVKPSEQQEAIFAALHVGKKDRKNWKIRYACFNNSTEREAIEKFPGEHCDVRGNHKLGFHALKAFLGVRGSKYYVQGGKYGKLLRDAMGINPFDDKDKWPEYTTTLKLASLARLTLTGHPIGRGTDQKVGWEVAEHELVEMANFYNIEMEEGGISAYKNVERLINLGIEHCRRTVDFDDMVFLPNVFGCRPEKVSRCYIDEFQDLNAAQQGIHIDPWYHSNTTAEQFVIVGDIYQSIYGFTGADPESMPRFEGITEATLLPLTVTRRCPKSHVEIASNYLPSDFGFRAADDAPDGIVERRSLDIEFYRSLSQLIGNDPKQTNLCLSRTNAPLVRDCFTCWKNGVPAIIRGRNVGDNLAAVIKKFSKNLEDDDCGDVLRAIQENYEAKIDKYEKTGKEDLAIGKKDELDILTMFLIEASSPIEAVEMIDEMFNDKEKLKAAVQFSTVHQAKGLEAQHTVILTPHLLPHPGLCKLGDFWAQQEENIAYVCYTRGQNRMVINNDIES